MPASYQINPDAIDAAELRQPLPLPSPPSAQEHAQDQAEDQDQDQCHPRLRVRGLFLVSGFAFGVLLGEAFFGGPFPAALVGLMGGMLVEFLSNRH